MRGYGETVHFSALEQSLLKKAQLLVNAVPAEFPPGIGLDKKERVVRCHELARAVGLILSLPVIDGVYGIVDHSWLEIATRKQLTVLDVYVPGGLPAVQLVDVSNLFLPKIKAYTARERRTDIRQKVLAELVRLMYPIQYSW
jgi:hypothetical protein